MNPKTMRSFRSRIGASLTAFLTYFIFMPLAWAQFPTLLPQKNEDIGGGQGFCIGLADMIRTGNIHLRDLPCFVKYFSQTLITVAASLSLIFVMIGGYRYVMGSVDDKESAQKTINYALIGLGVSLMAWIITDIALQLATE